MLSTLSCPRSLVAQAHPVLRAHLETILQAQSQDEKSNWRPRSDIVERNDSFLISLDLPGVDPKSVSIEVKDETLTISGTLDVVSDNDAKQLMRERRSGDFSRAFRVSERIDVDAISASSEHGVLRVVLPKKPEVQPRRIDVSV